MPAYTPPAATAVDFELETYTAPASTAVDFDLASSPPVGPVVNPTTGTTNGSGVKTTALTSDVPGTRVLTKAYKGATLVGLVTTLPS